MDSQEQKLHYPGVDESTKSKEEEIQKNTTFITITPENIAKSM